MFSLFYIIFVCHLPASHSDKIVTLSSANINIFMAKRWWPILIEAWSFLLRLAELPHHSSAFLQYSTTFKRRGTAAFLNTNKFVPTLMHWFSFVMAMVVWKTSHIEDIGRNQKENTWVILLVAFWGNVMGVTKYTEE